MLPRILATCLITCCVISHTSSRVIEPSSLVPIVLVPGNGGSRLEVKVDRPEGVSGVPGCADKRDWFRLWMNVWELLPQNVECWTTYITLNYNATSRRSHNSPGVTSRVPGFGGTEVMEYIDPSWTAWSLGNVGSYFAPLVKYLVSFGYTRGTTLRGAPYDFRFAPHSQHDYMRDLRTLIESTHAQNGNKRVMILTHSLGGLVAHYFLRSQPQAWRDTYIHSLMAVSTPWGGSAKMMELYTSGYSYGVSALDPLILREEQRSSESNTLLIPRAEALDAGHVLVATPTRNYTVRDYGDWFRDIGYTRGAEMLENVRGGGYELEHPGVDVYCWHGSGISTPDTVEYDSRFPDAPPVRTHHVTGDGSVSLSSLRMCERFLAHSRGHVASLRDFAGGEHLDIFTQQDFLTQLKRVLIGEYSESDLEPEVDDSNDGFFSSIFG